MRILSISTLFFLTSCSGFFYWPEKRQFLPYDKVTPKFKEYTITTLDGVNLHAVHFISDMPRPKTLILQFHGNAENLSTHMMSLAWLVKEGHDLLVFDYRGYGKSEGEPNQTGTYLDAKAALRLAREIRHQRDAERFIVYGQSLGGIIAANAVADDKELIHLLVLESTFGSYKEVAFKAMANNWITFIFSPLAYLLVSNEYGSYDKMPFLKELPLLVMHGTDDEVVPYRLGEKLYAMKEGPKWFWKIEGGKHIGAFFTKDLSYRKRFLKFIDNLDQEIQNAISRTPL